MTIMNLKLLSFVLSLSLITGLSITSSSAQAFSSLELATLKELKQDIHWTGNGNTSAAHSTLTFLVSSGGCTASADFKIKRIVMADTQHLTLVRVKDDLCKAVPSSVEIKIETDSLRVATIFPIVIENPILPNEAAIQPGTLVPVK